MMKRNELPEYLTMPAAARRSGLGIRQLRRGIDRGELAVFDVGGWPRLRWNDVLAWIETQRRTGPRHQNL